MTLPKIYIVGVKVDGVIREIEPLEITPGSDASFIMESRPTSIAGDAFCTDHQFQIDETPNIFCPECGIKLRP